ncbi:low-density lipoprotein receptor-related protein 5-like isoform X1 [Macrosteles quadrilineatus]|nr:low-density lipoprotein receptor-related protein 5-like isoform X1 [Macrosteles quadrilineatus]
MGTSGTDLLLVTDKGISLYNTTTGDIRKLMLENELMIKEVDFHYRRNEVYGLTRRQIIKCPLSNAQSYTYKPVVYSEDEYNFMSMAIDWVNDRLYWTAGPVFMIHKTTLNGSDHRVVFRGYYIENFHRKLLVDPYAKLLIWAASSTIYRSDLDGQDLQEIRYPEVLGNVRAIVRNLALDVTRGRLYFLAGFEDDDVWLLMSGRYDGSEFRRHDSVSRFTYSLTALGDDIYWVSKEFGEAKDHARDHTKRPHTIVLYKASALVVGSQQKILDLQTGAVWSMKICDAESQGLLLSSA